MYRIAKSYDFSASHVLNHLPEGHPCARLHGHNYTVQVEVECPCLDDRGFCQVDYGELKPFEDMIAKEFDHRHLNDVMPIRPTAENLAKYLYARAKAVTPYVVAVRVAETPRTWAEYRGPR